ncbi:MAG: hypothetical protein AAFQ29_07450 [Pseudomonadota bacterium]
MLWKAGSLRLRGVLIGTVAFQAEAGLLALNIASYQNCYRREGMRCLRHKFGKVHCSMIRCLGRLFTFYIISVVDHLNG